MPSPFPGMDPFLERGGIWEEFHTRFIVAIADELGPLVRPGYRVSVEQRTYLTVDDLPEPVGKPDVLITALPGPRPEMSPVAAASRSTAGILPVVAELPWPDEVVERYLEVRDVATNDVVTVIELLSLSNKLAGEGRRQYERKRLGVLASQTHLVEIDLLRGGSPLPMRIPSGGVPSDYRIVVSRAWERPRAEVYLFGIRDVIPAIAVPLRHGESEPQLGLNDILRDVYARAGFDLVVDYGAALRPALGVEDRSWVEQMIADQASAVDR